ncbi:hypothetical protein SNE40_004258 [Patella caerulea]|uniref:ADF-H domain-containing protein n=1 Tax=Patella caerulea TaxID=87958 RepID=A0AAN8Q1P9_PATCE
MSSGVKVGQDITDKYHNIKMGKLHRFVSLRLVEVEDGSTGGKTLTFAPEREMMKEDQRGGDDPLTDVIEFMKDNCARFIILDYPVFGKSEGSSKHDELFLIQYIPDACKVKDRMVYAASAQCLKKVVNCKFIQMNDWEDLTPELLQEVCGGCK